VSTPHPVPGIGIDEALDGLSSGLVSAAAVDHSTGNWWFQVRQQPG
jgi:hypothetical protein